MNVKEIVKKYCEENKFDGLFNSDIDCCCELDDLMPCEWYTGDCEPGFKKQCKCEDYDEEHCDTDSGWCIGDRK